MKIEVKEGQVLDISEIKCIHKDFIPRGEHGIYTIGFDLHTFEFDSKIERDLAWERIKILLDVQEA